MSRNTGNNMGRPIKDIDFEELKKLCEFQATLTEIASWFNMSEDTLETRVKEEYGMTFSEYFKLNSGRGKASLRRTQYTKAIEGNVPLLIWLGKQWLGQSDKLETVNQDLTPPEINITFGDKSKRSNHIEKDPVIVDGKALKDDTDK